MTDREATREQISEQKLNENVVACEFKLRAWVGFKVEGSGTPYWHVVYPDGSKHSEYPSFTQSLDACFKWLVPKLRLTGYFTVLRDLLDNFRCHIVPEDSTKKSWFGRAETPALALCLVIEKLIDEEVIHGQQRMDSRISKDKTDCSEENRTMKQVKELPKPSLPTTRSR